MLRLPRSCVRRTEPRPWVWTLPKQDVGGNGVCVCNNAAGTGVCAVHAEGVSNGGTEYDRLGNHTGAGSNERNVARGKEDI